VHPAASDGLPSAITAIDRLQQAMKRVSGPERDALFGTLGAIAGRIHAVELIAEEEPGLPADATGYEETWEDVKRLQSDGIEPQAFTAVTAPAVLIQGDSDPHPGRLIYARLHTYIPQLTFSEIANSGHTLWQERAGREPFLDRLTTWLSAATTGRTQADMP
jgi:pimeloyl-ACP methyl ester carboxylesterase